MPDLWTRFRRARLVRVLAVYLGAAWLILQVANELRVTLGMPQWVAAAAFLLLLVGLVIIVFTAWVQSHPALPEREAGAEVPGSWELSLRGIPDALARGRLPHPTWPRAIAGGLVAFSLLFGVAGFYVVVKDRGRAFAPAEAVASVAPGIAVLPFSVTGADPGVWREGMVDLLSTNLDGVGGLRAISSRTVLARWREQVAEDGAADLTALLDVARASGARYALVGSVVRADPGLRLAATVYDAATAQEIGRAQAQGSPDSVFALVDRLTIGVIGAVLAAGSGEFVPLPGLASLTTTSLPALRAFLVGASHQRRADFPRAIAAYTEAVTADSTFALAATRLSEMYGWNEGQGERAGEYAELAGRWADRMPAREALLIRTRLAFERGDPEGLDLARRAVAAYPDDAEAWYALGDFLYHMGDAALADPAEAIRAFDRAIELDPSAAVYYRHAIQLAVSRGDAPRARALLDAYRGLAAPADPGTISLPLLYDLAMGDSAARAAAVAALDTLAPDRIGSVMSSFGSPSSLPLHVPALDAFTTAITALSRRPDAPPFLRFVTVGNATFVTGRLDQAIQAIRTDARIPADIRLIQLYIMHLFELGAPQDLLERELLAPAAIDAPMGDMPIAAPIHLLAIGAYAADRGRWDIHDRVVAAARSGEAEARAAADSTAMEGNAAVADALGAYAAWRRGRAAEARIALERVLHAAATPAIGGALGAPVRWWLGMLHAAEGRPADAIPYVRTFSNTPIGQLALGGLYEQIGDEAAASRAYALAAAAWHGADPGFAPLQRALDGVARLSPDR